MAALLPGVLPWDVERMSPRQVGVLLSGAQWREERVWDAVRALSAAVAASQGAKTDLSDLGESRVPGYRSGE